MIKCIIIYWKKYNYPQLSPINSPNPNRILHPKLSNAHTPDQSRGFVLWARGTHRFSFLMGPTYHIYSSSIPFSSRVGTAAPGASEEAGVMVAPPGRCRRGRWSLRAERLVGGGPRPDVPFKGPRGAPPGSAGRPPCVRPHRHRFCHCKAIGRPLSKKQAAGRRASGALRG